MNILMFLPIIIPLIGAFIVYLFKDNQRLIKNIVLASVSILTLVFCVINCFINNLGCTLVQVTENMSFAFRVDNFSRFFSVLVCFVWIVVTFYTFEYIKHEGNENRFYTFMFLTLSVLIALCYSSNIVTMYLSFELVTLCSMPLVLHSLSKESINAALKYLFYSIGGAFIALFGIFFIAEYSKNAPFEGWGGLECFKHFAGNKNLFNVAVFLVIVGFGTKAGMFPMHGWLPIAHPVAPAPASALLSGVITKAGIIAIIRVIYYVVGPDFIEGTWVQYAWLGLATFTVFLGSMMAYLEKNFKKRLAYSSVSQLSYIIVSLAFLNKVAFIGALIHIVAHMLIKITLFLYAGEMIYRYDYHKVDELRGIGKKLPISTWCYTFASLGLVGIPMTIGFISKWNIASGAISSTASVFSWLTPVILLISAILTAGYLLPITINGLFVGKDETYTREKENKLMFIPMIILATLIVFFGIYSQPIVEIANLIIGK